MGGLRKVYKALGLTRTQAFDGRAVELWLDTDDVGQRLNFTLLPASASPSSGLADSASPPARLVPHRPKADEDYLIFVAGGEFVRTKHHETLVNDFADFLGGHGLSALSNKAIDLGLQKPPVVIEAKEIDGEAWTPAIREAVGQLYEYRHFEVCDPEAALVFLASMPVPEVWVDYLENDREIAVAWRTSEGFFLTERARTALGLPAEGVSCHPSA